MNEQDSSLRKRATLLGDAIVQGAELADVRSAWGDWLDLNQDNLCELDDEVVIARARLNEAAERRHNEDEVEGADVLPAAIPANNDALLAEIPRGNTRWNQANFDKQSFEQFFGLRPGERQRVVLFPVLPNGTVGEPEVRPSVDVKSRNFRIELGQAAGLAYPTAGRPIGVFLKLGTRRFRYSLLMPGHDDYAAVEAFLRDRVVPPPRRVRRLRLPYDELRQLLPGLIRE